MEREVEFNFEDREFLVCSGFNGYYLKGIARVVVIVLERSEGGLKVGRGMESRI